MAEMNKLDDMDLGNVSGGVNKSGDVKWKWVVARVDTGYLPLRSFPSYDERNEKVKLVDGTAFQIDPSNTNGDYVYAYFNGEYGWVNTNKIAGFEMHGTAY